MTGFRNFQVSSHVSMKPFLKLTAAGLLFTTIILLFFVVKAWNYQFDQHGYYTGSDGIIHRESVSERNFFSLILSVLLLLVTAYTGFKKNTGVNETGGAE